MNSNAYLQFKEKQSKEFNNFVKGKMFICFSDDDIHELMKEKGFKKVVKIGLSCFINADYYQEYIKLCDKQENDLKQFVFTAKPAMFIDILIYEFYNHENIYNSGYYDTLKYNLYFSDDDLKKYNNTIKTAIKEYEKEFI